MKVLDVLLSVLLAFSPVKPQTLWSEWSNWSLCSRTCGGGITYQERTCLTNSCTGDRRKYDSCNIQDCPNGVEEFRKEQCAEYNSFPHYNGEYYKWVPYSGASDNPCSLSCMPKGEFFYVTFKEKVVDGTRCDDSTYNMCVDGVCRKTGCDLILGSDAKEDKCRVCNGEGNNCRTIQKVYRAKPKGTGYLDILAIPAGATNILIKDATSNYLALKNSSHSYIINGGMRIMQSTKLKGAGATIKYKRKAAEESIFVLGPTTDVLYVALLYIRRVISVSYEYSIPKTQKIEDHAITYSWSVGQYSKCNKKCSGGTKTRRVYCVRGRDKVEVKSSKCDGSSKPETQTTCNEQPCPPRWFIGAWGPCSRTCGEGSQVRRVHCEQESVAGTGMVNENLCPGTKVISRRKCIDVAECPKWTLGKWSACSRTCGGGTRTRTVECIEINNNAINDDRCPSYTRPRDTETCNNTPCGVRWVLGDWGSCHPSCGQGMRTRSAYCASSTQITRRYPDYMCNIKDKPVTMKECNNTQKCPPMWYGSSWSKCTASCGKGMQVRNVFCGVKGEKDIFLRLLPNGNCSYLPQLKKMQTCKIKPCHTQWIALSWKPCSSTCGNGKRLRDVKCFSDNEEDKSGRSCDPKQKPPAEDICNLVDCPAISRPTSTSTIPVLTEPPTTRLIQPEVVTKKPEEPRITTGKPEESRVTTRRATQPVVIKRTTRPTVARITRRYQATTKGPLSSKLFPTRVTLPEEVNGIGGKSMPAEIVRGPVSKEAVVGSTVTFSCVTTGNPRPTIFWMKGNLDVSIFGQRYQELSNGSLRILAVQQVDHDVYTCVATNGLITQRSQPAILFVTTPPYVDITLGYTVKMGEKASIECKASGKPRPTVQWYKDGRKIEIQRNDKITVTPGKISIKSAKLSDQGKYKCKATNKNGVRTAQTMLDVLPDKKTRLHDIMNGNCQDDITMVKCSDVASIDGYCDRPYYQKVCCKTCREKNKKDGKLGNI